MKETESDKIWIELKNKPLNMYGMTDSVVEQYVTRYVADDRTLLVKLKVSGAMAALGEVLGNKFSHELMPGGFVSIQRAGTDMSQAKRA